MNTICRIFKRTNVVVDSVYIEWGGGGGGGADIDHDDV